MFTPQQKIRSIRIIQTNVYLVEKMRKKLSAGLATGFFVFGATSAQLMSHCRRGALDFLLSGTHFRNPEKS